MPVTALVLHIASFSRKNIKRFPLRITKPKVKLPKLKITKKPLLPLKIKPIFNKPKPVKTVYKSAKPRPVKTVYNSGNGAKFNVDVMITPGNDYQFVTSTKNSDVPKPSERPEYSLVVDMSSSTKNDLSNNNYIKHGIKTDHNPVNIISVPVHDNYNYNKEPEPEIVYGTPKTQGTPDVVSIPEIPANNAAIHQNSVKNTGKNIYPYYSSSTSQSNDLPGYGDDLSLTGSTSTSLDIPTNALQDGFLPSKQYLMMAKQTDDASVDNTAITTTSTANNLQFNEEIPVIKSTLEQKNSYNDNYRAPPIQQYVPRKVHHQTVNNFNSINTQELMKPGPTPPSPTPPRPTHPPQSRFQELRTVSSLR